MFHYVIVCPGVVMIDKFFKVPNSLLQPIQIKKEMRIIKRILFFVLNLVIVIFLKLEEISLISLTALPKNCLAIKIETFCKLIFLRMNI